MQDVWHEAVDTLQHSGGDVEVRGGLSGNLRLCMLVCSAAYVVGLQCCVFQTSDDPGVRHTHHLGVTRK
jgi:hypothetical protein